MLRRWGLTWIGSPRLTRTCQPDFQGNPAYATQGVLFGTWTLIPSQDNPEITVDKREVDMLDQVVVQ